jgi:hypothetical protein
VTVKQKAKASVPKSVQEDRRQLVEAAIVRIMKTRTVSHFYFFNPLVHQYLICSLYSLLTLFFTAT